MTLMQSVDAATAQQCDLSYREHTRVHSLLATDDDIYLPDGTYVDDESGTITRDDYRRLAGV